MKKYILIALVFIGTTVAAQNINQPKLETKGPLTVATYYYDNGSVQQEGFGIDNISLDVATAINEVSNNSFEFNIYPNPTEGQFTLIVPTTREAMNVEVFDTKGQLIYSELMNAVDSRINKVNIDQLSKGLYFVKVSDNKSSSIKKLIVQ